MSRRANPSAPTSGTEVPVDSSVNFDLLDCSGEFPLPLQFTTALSGKTFGRWYFQFKEADSPIVPVNDSIMGKEYLLDFSENNQSADNRKVFLLADSPFNAASKWKLRDKDERTSGEIVIHLLKEEKDEAGNLTKELRKEIRIKVECKFPNTLRKGKPVSTTPIGRPTAKP